MLESIAETVSVALTASGNHVTVTIPKRLESSAP
jgi:hypothetical protein